jgi:Cu-processing system permease protein
VTTTATVLRYELQDLRRSRWIAGYVVLLFLLTTALLRFGGGGPRAVLSLMNVVLAFVPLASLVLGTMYLYGSRQFIELLLAQPVGRSALFVGLYAGLAAPLAGGFLLGVGLPFLVSDLGDSAIIGPVAILLGAGTLLTLAFTALAVLISLLVGDRVKGLGLAILLWLAVTALYDALIVLVASNLSNVPLEGPLIGLILLNPVDLGRVLLLLHLDTAALTGYTGAVFERFFGSLLGTGIVALALVFWCAGPLLWAHHRFGRKDF